MKDKPIVHKNVLLGRAVTIEPFCVIGKPPKGKKEGELTLTIGDGSLIRSFSTIYAGTRIGKYFTTGTMVSIREDNIIGDHVVVGTGTILEFGNKIGNNVRIHSGCFMEMAEIEDNAVIGPCVVMIDDLHLPCPRMKECVGGVKIGRGAKIGANTTLLPGVKIGRNALIGAGSVVTKDIPQNAVAVGNPAKVIKRIGELGCHKKFFKKPYDWERI